MNRNSHSFLCDIASALEKVEALANLYRADARRYEEDGEPSWTGTLCLHRAAKLDAAADLLLRIADDELEGRAPSE